MNMYKIAQFSLDTLANEFGTPLYILDGGSICKRASAFNDTKKNRNFNVIFAYANKAFCSLATTRLLDKNFDFYFDVVSAGEIALMLKSGVDSNKLLFHGNNKTKSELEYAIKKNIGYFVVDNYSELQKINKVSKKKQSILVRINPCIHAETHSSVQTANWDSKFGFTMSEETLKIIEEINKGHNFKGIHIHIGSQIFGTKSYFEAIDQILVFIKKINQLGILIETLDLGGGFGIKYTDKDPEITDKVLTENINEILDYLTVRLKENNVELKNVIFEPGRSLIANAGYTLYRVGDIKKFDDKKTYIVVDGGMYESPRHALYGSSYTVSSVKNPDSEKTKKVTIVGKCCESGDIIVEDVMLQDVEIGDLIVVESTGAYNHSMASNYNQNTIPPVLMVLDNKKEIIIKGQSIDELISRNVLPEWLK